MANLKQIILFLVSYDMLGKDAQIGEWLKQLFPKRLVVIHS